VALIALAAALDGIDGRLARLLKQESKLGAELDSLADFLNFGVAPALALWLWGMQEMQSLGWIAVLVFAVACVLRLARFNVASRTPAAEVDKAYFTGVPAPAGGLLAMLPIYLGELFPALPPLPGPVVALWLAAVALLMVSRVPTWSFMAATFYAENAKFELLAFVVLVAGLLTYPWAVLVAVSVAYLGTIVFSWRAWRRAHRKAEPDHAD
jgi:CDP-diacylglycerol--serine O-phosphatidyltransferase